MTHILNLLKTYSTTFSGWILKTCPYFDVLDEVLGTRPNITPPAVIFTADLDNEVPTKNEGVNMDEMESPPDQSEKKR